MSKSFNVRDKYFKKAKDQGYRARSAFKLLEIQKKFRLIKKGDVVVDLGAAPGSFIQVISEIVGEDGMVAGIDLEEMQPMDLFNVTLLQGDIFNEEPLVRFLEDAGYKPADVVTSDLAPKTSGIRDLDQGRSMQLTDQAAEIAMKILKPGGDFIGKIFQGEELHHFLIKMKRHFKKVQTYKPKATRERSFETYVIAEGFQPDTIRS